MFKERRVVGSRTVGGLAGGLKRHAAVSGLAAAAIAFTGCAAESTSDDGFLTENAAAKGDRGGKQVVYLEQGWDAATRAAFYQTSEGSRMLPYKWFLHLEQADKKKLLRDPKNIRAMGYLVEDEATEANPDRLPVGFARDVDLAGGDYIGLTCAGCHTGELEYKGRAVRIDGGQSLADLEQLQEAILASLQATLDDSRKFERFANNVLGGNAGNAERSQLLVEINEARDWWVARLERSRGQSPHGPGRTDAFTIIGNEVVCALFEDPRNCQAAIAPTQFPYLWNTSDFEWVQYNSSVHSPIGRNVGQATGTFTQNTLDLSNPYGLIVESSANVENLDALEGWVQSLQSPAWPEELFGAIDQQLASQGAALYAENCASCHTLDPQPRTDPNAYGKTFAKTNFSTPLFPGPNGEVSPQGLLGTDPTAAVSFATRKAFPGPFTAIAQAQGLVGGDGKASAAALINISGQLLIKRFFAENGLTDAEKIAYLGFREPLRPTQVQLTTYRARPLNGAVFTAPYLHNGSVPSLYELLLPPEQRSAQFYVGSKKFDPVRVGLDTRDKKNAALFDTTQVGNGNGGHYWGTDFSDAERMAVIEYMKTL